MSTKLYRRSVSRFLSKQMWLLFLLVFTTIKLIPLMAQEVDHQTELESTIPVRGLDIKIFDQQDHQVLLYKESHALVIGISNYTYGWPNLPGVQRDVKEVKTALEAHGFNVVVQMDLDKNALGQAFDEFITKYGYEPENRLLFYFLGHGHTTKLATGVEMGYIIPADAPLPDEDAHGFFATAMDLEMIEVYAKRIESKHALFVFDSCFSGSIFALSRAAPKSITYKTAYPVRQFITSGSADEQVPDESIFCQQFIAALKGEADMNKDEYVTGAELGIFLENKVIIYSNGAQHPQYGKIRDPNLDKGDFVFQLHIVIDPLLEEHEAAMWKLVKDSNSIADVREFLVAFPQGRFTQVARFKLKQLERQIDQLLEKADSYFQRQWYTAPAETNAFDEYREVLKLDPTNTYAHQQINTIAAFYKSRGEQEEQRGRMPQALEAYRTYLTIVPNDEAILDKVVMLEHPIVIPTSMPTPIPPTPTPLLTTTPRPEIQITDILVVNQRRKEVIEPVEGIYTVKHNEVITITVNFSNPYNHDIEVNWTAGRGRIPPIENKTNIYAATEKGSDYIKIFVQDTETGDNLEYPLSINVVE